MYILIIVPACLDGCILGPAACGIPLAPKQHPRPSVPHHIPVQGPAQEPLLRLASRWQQVSGQRPGPSCVLSLRHYHLGCPGILTPPPQWDWFAPPIGSGSEEENIESLEFPLCRVLGSISQEATMTAGLLRALRCPLTPGLPPGGHCVFLSCILELCRAQDISHWGVGVRRWL